MQRADPSYIKQHLSVVGKRIVYELRGVPNLELEQINSKKSITVSRSFGEVVNDLEDLKKLLANHIFRAAEKLPVAKRFVWISTCFYQY